MEEMFTPLRKYATFSGRATQKEYWLFFLLWVAGSVVLTLTADVLDSALGTNVAGTVLGTYLLVMLVPGLAALVRRLHDSDRSGAWFFVYFIPLIGGLWLLILLADSGTIGPNRYGPDPRVKREPVDPDILDAGEH